MNVTRQNDVIIRIHDLNKWYGEFHVLKNINLEVRKQEKIVICGPSGSGKSTLIRCINRLEEHQKGKIIVDDLELTNNLKNIEKIRTEVGMVFQHFNLFPHLTILDNLTLGRYGSGRPLKRKPKRPPCSILKKSKSQNRQKNIQASFPVASSSEWPLPEAFA